MVEGMPVVLGLGIVTSAVVLVLIGLRLRLFGRLRSGHSAKPEHRASVGGEASRGPTADLLTPEEYSNLRAKGYLEVGSQSIREGVPHRPRRHDAYQPRERSLQHAPHWAGIAPGRPTWSRRTNHA